MTRRTGRRRVILVCAALSLAMAGCVNDTVPGVFHQPDAGPPDGWSEAPWSPQGCTVYQATDPSQSVPELSWQPCSNGVTGCVFQDVRQLPPDVDAFGLEGVHRYGKRTIFVERWSGNTESVETVYELGKGPIAAWLSQGSGCGVAGMSLSEAGAIQQVDMGYYGSITSFLRYGTVDQIVAGTAPSTSIDSTVTGTFANVVGGALGTTVMALQVAPDNTILVEAPGSDQPKAIPKPSDTAEDMIVEVKGGEVLFERDSGIALRHTDGSVIMLYRKSGVEITDVTSDGAQVVWQQITQPAGAGMTCELWTSPWASDAASFKPHVVKECDFHWPDVTFSGGGYYLYDHNSTTLRAVRLSDGAHIDIPAPVGSYWSGWAGVIGSEIWSGVSFQAGNPYEVDTIARIPLASLAAPTP